MKVAQITTDLAMGIDVCGCSVQDFVEQFLNDKRSYIRGEMEGKIDGGKRSITKERYQLIEGKLRNYFIPFLGATTGASSLTPKHFAKWDLWRKLNPAGVGKKKTEPKQSTLSEEMTLIREVWSWGIKDGFIRQSLKKPFDGYNLVEDEKVRRTTWELPQWNEFVKRERVWFEQEQRTEDQDRIWESFIAHQLIFILACSGLRPKEWSLLKWRDVSIFDIEDSVDENEKLGAEMSIHKATKTGQRKAYCRGGIYFQRIFDKTKFKALNDYVFTDLKGKRLETEWFSEIFNGQGKCNGLMEHTGMYQLTGEHFVPYCLRHFYASQSIYNGVPEDVIADNMGITKIRLNRSYKHCFMRLRTKDLFRRTGSQMPIKNMRTFGIGEYAFYRGTQNQQVPSSGTRSSKYGLFFSDKV